MKRFTFHAIIVIFIICVIPAAMIITFNHLKILSVIDERNLVCYEYGLNLTTYMRENMTEAVAGCECYYKPIVYKQDVTDCVCDCLVPGIPISVCNTVRGCFLQNNSCYCSYGIFTI